MLRILTFVAIILLFLLFIPLKANGQTQEEVCEKVTVGEGEYYADKEQLGIKFSVPKGPTLKVGGKLIEIFPSGVEDIELNNNALPTTVAPKCGFIQRPLPGFGGAAMLNWECTYEGVKDTDIKNIFGKPNLPNEIDDVDVKFTFNFQDTGKTQEQMPCPETTSKINMKVENTARQNVPLPPIPPTPQEKPFPTCSPEDFQKGVCTTAEGKPCSADPEHLAFSTAIGCIRTNPSDLAMDLLKFGIGTGGGLSFLMMLFGAFQMLTSSGNPETLNAGRSRITSAVIGLLFIIFGILFLKIIGVDILNLSGFTLQ